MRILSWNIVSIFFRDLIYLVLMDCRMAFGLYPSIIREHRLPPSSLHSDVKYVIDGTLSKHARAFSTNSMPISYASKVRSDCPRSEHLSETLP